MSSPLLNNIIIVGSLLMYVEVALASTDYLQAGSLELRSRLCMVRLTTVHDFYIKLIIYQVYCLIR